MKESSELTVAMVGDFMMQQRAEAADIARVNQLLGDATIRVANLDTVLSDVGRPTPKYSNLRGPQGAVDDLRAMGFDVVTLANNHAMDYGPEGLLDMRRALEDAGVRAAGAGANLDEAMAPVELAGGGWTVAIVALACTLPPLSEAGPARPGVAPVRVHQAYEFETSLAAEQPGSVPAVKTWVAEADRQRAVERVNAARTRAEFVIVAVHWGVPALWRAPLQPRVQEYQRVLGRALIDAGADAVIGNHPHELHEIELYRERPIAYSLGNFWIDSLPSRQWMGRETVVLKLCFPTTGPPQIHVLPLRLSEQGFPYPDPARRALNVLAEMSDRLSIEPLPDGRWFRLG